MSVRRRSNTALNRRSSLTARVLRWYGNNGRQLPWRNENDPYRVLVSEVMLQQTQVSRVLIKYPRFLKRFPTFKKLANAKTSDVIRAWEGMGYNNRALRLQRLAVTVLDQHRGKLPRTIREMESLPGIGRYTAHALACFSFGRRVPVVDTNIKRVLTRLRSLQRRGPTPKEADIWDLARSLLPRRHSHDWNQALMDLGATICIATQPKCGLCPLADLCPSAHRVIQRTRQAKKPEPGRDGIPNRIYRGRTIQALRELKTQDGITRTSLARKIKPDFTSVDRRWFDALLQGLQNDGLIHIRAGKRISLPE